MKLLKICHPGTNHTLHLTITSPMKDHRQAWTRNVTMKRTSTTRWRMFIPTPLIIPRVSLNFLRGTTPIQNHLIRLSISIMGPTRTARDQPK